MAGATWEDQGVVLKHLGMMETIGGKWFRNSDSAVTASGSNSNSKSNYKSNSDGRMVLVTDADGGILTPYVSNDFQNFVAAQPSTLVDHPHPGRSAGDWVR